MSQNSKQSITRGDIEKLLDGQTKTILVAVDFKLSAFEKGMNKRDARFEKKLDRLITTLDKFLKRLTDLKDEFTMMKNDINRLKTVIREKLGVSL